MSQPHVKREQPKLFPGRKPIIQRAERVIQSKTRSKVSTPECSIITESSGHHDKVIPVSQTMSEHDSSSRTIRRKGKQDFRREIPSNDDPMYRPPPKLTEIPTQVTSKKIPESDIDVLQQDINTDFEENSPYQEDVISETYQRPDKSYFQEPPELQGLASTGKLVQKILPKQADIDKTLKILQRKVLKGTHLPVTVKEIQVGYLISPYFKDLYLYLEQNKLPSTK